MKKERGADKPFCTMLQHTNLWITANRDHDKYITTQEFNKLTTENFTTILKQANLASKNDVANL